MSTDNPDPDEPVSFADAEMATSLADLIRNQAAREKQGPPAPDKLPRSPEADKAAGRLRDRFADALNAASEVRGHKRRATALDVTDFEAAYDELLNPGTRHWGINCLIDIAVLASGGFLGYGINILTGGADTASRGWLAVLPAIFIGLMCAILKYLPTK